MADEQHTPIPMTDEQLQAMRKRHWMNGLAWDEQRDLLAEVERLRARAVEWDSKEQAMQKSIAEHERVIARIEARYEQQGQYNHQLVRRLVGALEIAREVAEAPLEVGTVNKVRMRLLLLRSDVRHVQEQARALLAQDEEQETSQ